MLLNLKKSNLLTVGWVFTPVASYGSGSVTYALRSCGNVCLNKLRLKPYGNIRVTTVKYLQDQRSSKNEGGHQYWSSSETPFVQIISWWRPVELPEFPGWRTRSITTLNISTSKKVQIFMCKQHFLVDINTFTAIVDLSRFNNSCLKSPASTLVDLIIHA